MPETRRDVVVRIAAQMANRGADPFKPLVDSSKAADRIVQAQFNRIQDRLSQVTTAGGAVKEVLGKAFDVKDAEREIGRLSNRIEATLLKIKAGQGGPNAFRLLERDVISLTNAAEGAATKMIGGFKQAAAGATQALRGVVFLLASSEEEAAKMMKTMARFQGVIDLVSGITSAVVGSVTAWAQYAAAVKAAAAAQATMQAVQAGSGAVGSAAAGAAGAGAGRAIGGAAVGGAAGGAAVGWGAAIMGGIKTGIMAGLGALKTAAVAVFSTVGIAIAAPVIAVASTVVAKSETAATAVMKLARVVGFFGDTTEKAFAELTKQRMEHAKKVQEGRETAASAELGIRGGGLESGLTTGAGQANLLAQQQAAAQGLLGVEKDIFLIEQERASTLQTHTALTQGVLSKMHDIEGLASVELFQRQRELDLTQKLIQIEERRVDVLRRQKQEQIDAMNKQRDALQSQLSATNQIIDAERNRLKTLEEQYGALDELARAQVKSALDRVSQVGFEGVTPEEREKARQFAPTKFGEFARGVAQREGFGETLGRVGETRRLEDATREKERLQNLVVEIKNQIQATIQLNERELADMLAERLGPKFKQIDFILQQIEEIQVRKAEEAGYNRSS